MSLKTLVRDLVSDAIKTIDDLADAIVYTSVGDLGTYDPSTDTFVGGTTVVVGSDPNDPLMGALARFKFEEVDDSIVVQTDMKAIIADKDLNGVEPKKNDTLVAKGKTWNVQAVKGVPGEGVWLIHIREQ